MDKSLVVSVVAPLQNAALFVGQFVEQLAAVLSANYKFYEIILVDDGSDDATGAEAGEVLKKLDRIRFLQLSRKYGREIAIAAGLETAIGDFVITLDPETDPVRMIPDLVEKCRKGSGVLCGVSSLADQASLLTRIAAGAFHGYCRKFLAFDYKENSTDFRILSRQAVNAITRIRDRRRYLRVFTATLGYNQEFFTYEPKYTRAVRNSLMERIDHAMEIAIANSRHPLRVVSRLGLALSAINLLYALYVLCIYLFKRDVAAGWTTMSMQMTGMFFFIFLILAVLCEYIGRILEETQERPLYFVSAERTSSVLLENSIETNILNEAKV